MWKNIFVLISLVCLVSSMPKPQDEATGKPEPYQYDYTVKDAKTKTFFDKNESGDETGKVQGKYSVWLPDGRLMTVEYYVEKDSGFKPEIKFQDANPFE